MHASRCAQYPPPAPPAARRPAPTVWSGASVVASPASPWGRKSYSKTKPIRLEEFDAEKAWWNERTENAYAWRVPAEEIRRLSYNLDIKNPNVAAEDHRDPDELLTEYRQVLAEVAETRDALKAALTGALKSALAEKVKA